ncbi:MAG: hypothetical protein NC912_00235 [Candidatus Omnitrophica bacterium]|nr:hypothetical protein [Candidatus Omnitrophota bacterium]
MKEYLKELPQGIFRLIKLAQDISSTLNYNVYLVGGFVRDLLLRVKNLDLDMVVEKEGIGFAEEFAKRLNARIIRHKRFGTATLVINSDFKVDIATTRKETYRCPASLPQVSLGTLRDDLFRRDFTINAMAIQIGPDNFGRLIDFFGGRDDLKKERIRVLHNLSFIDDPTRILRAIRFEQRYNFKIESKTIKLLKEAVKLGMLKRVSPHRLRDEIILLLKEKEPLKNISRLNKLTGFGFIDPALSLSEDAYKFLKKIKKEIAWFKKEYPDLRPIDTWLVYFIGLIDCLTLAKVKRLGIRFAFCRADRIRMISYKKQLSKVIKTLSLRRISAWRLFRILQPLSYETILLIKAKSKNKDVNRHIKEFFDTYHGIRVSLDGNDLKNLGLPPGPLYQRIFERILKEKLKGRLKTRQQELLFVKRILRLE